VDKKRSRNFSKLVARDHVRGAPGRADSDSNLKLKYAIEKARAANVPKDNIERVIKRAMGEQAATWRS
jgi:transcriptional/translational regulatory protein YebC/TACO1